MFYSFSEILKNVIYICYTKIFWGGGARLIRYPIVVRNKKYFKFAKNFTCGLFCRFTAGSSKDNAVVVGENFMCGDFCQIEGQAGIIIGNNVLIGSKVLLCTTSHGNYQGVNCDSPDIPPLKREIYCKRIRIGDNVWIGNNVCILPGCTIGSGVIIGAGAIVTNDIPNNCIAVGNPAKVIKKYDFGTHCWSTNLGGM